LLEDKGIAYRYRDYRKEPLAEAEIRSLLAALGLSPAQLLRKADRWYRELKLTGKESDEELIVALAAHPTLLQRPIGVRGSRAVVGRPPEKLLEL